jgi:outer membrane biosynthesis protein TonB
MLTISRNLMPMRGLAIVECAIAGPLLGCAPQPSEPPALAPAQSAAQSAESTPKPALTSAPTTGARQSESNRQEDAPPKGPSVQGSGALIQRRVLQCYRLALANNPELQGRLEVRIILDRSGQVLRAEELKSTLPSRPAINCILHTFDNLKFDVPEGPEDEIVIRYPLVFLPPRQ